MILALILFIATYAMLILLPKYRPYIAVTSAALFIILGILPVNEVFGAIDWNVILMIGGIMGTVSLFIESKMPALLADLLIERTPNVKWAIISLSLLAAVISAFVDNVATVLMVAPIAVTISKKLKTSPVPIIISISIASNLQGAATLVGDTTSILLGGHANMNFFDFFWYQGKPGLFFIVQVACILATAVLAWQFRNEKEKMIADERTKVENYFPSFLLVGTILALICASFIPNTPDITNGIICVAFFAVGLIHAWVTRHSVDFIKSTLKDIDVFTLLLLAGLFVVIAGITEAGVIDKIAELFAILANGNVFLIYTLIVWASVLFSAFIDNIPYVATMLPVASGIASLMGIDPTLLYFGLLIGATLGGNLTPIGASANIAGIGILRKEGYEVSTGQFMKVSVPYTLTAVITGYILVWILFA